MFTPTDKARKAERQNERQRCVGAARNEYSAEQNLEPQDVLQEVGGSHLTPPISTGCVGGSFRYIQDLVHFSNWGPFSSFSWHTLSPFGLGPEKTQAYPSFSCAHLTHRRFINVWLPQNCRVQLDQPLAPQSLPQSRGKIPACLQFSR